MIEGLVNGFPDGRLYAIIGRQRGEVYEKNKRSVLDFFEDRCVHVWRGYAMVALLEREFVEDKQWLSREEFLDMVAIAESTPGPVAVNSATYVGYKIEGAEGAAASTLAVCLPSFVVIYLISLVFDRFLQLSAVASAFRGIQVCVIYLILSAGMKMLKSLSGTAFNRIIVAGVVAAMVGCSMAAVSFSSLYYILLCGAAGVLLYLLKKLRKEEKA